MNDMRTIPREGDPFKFRGISIYEENIGVIGEHYSGKTWHVLKRIIKSLVDANVNLWFWDHNGRTLTEDGAGIFEPDQICYYLDDLQYGTQCYIPESKSEEHFNKFCKIVQEQANLHVVLDELHNFMSAQTMEKELKPVIRDLPANRGVTYTAIWQRASEGHKSVLSNARYKFLFKYDPLDQDRYLRTFGTKASLLLEKSDREFYPLEENCKDYSYVFLDDKRRFQTEFYNGGKFHEPRTPSKPKKGDEKTWLNL